jgi:hypothetical protein
MLVTPPYIGITGITNKAEYDHLVELYNRKAKNSSPLLMMGVLVSYKSLNDQPTTTRYPNRRDLFSIFNNDNPRILNFIHYTSKVLDTLFDQVFMAISYCGGDEVVNGIQFNIPFPDIQVLNQLKEQYHGIKLVFQANNAVLSNPFSQTLTQLIQYEKCVDYMLLDISGGTGKEFDPGSYFDLIFALEKLLPQMRFGIAGGLNAENLEEKISMIIQNFKHVSIDSEGKLRDENDMLDLEKASQYLEKALSVYETYSL